MGRYGTIGLEVFIAIALGFWFGTYLDQRLGSAPWGLFFFGMCGLIAAGRAFYRIIQQYQRDNRGEGPKP